MSVDFYLVSPGNKCAVMVGSNGFSGPFAWPGEPECVKFIRWAVENNIEDIVFMNEYVFDVLRDNEDWPDDYRALPALTEKDKDDGR